MGGIADAVGNVLGDVGDAVGDVVSNPLVDGLALGAATGGFGLAADAGLGLAGSAGADALGSGFLSTAGGVGFDSSLAGGIGGGLLDGVGGGAALSGGGLLGSGLGVGSGLLDGLGTGLGSSGFGDIGSVLSSGGNSGSLPWNSIAQLGKGALGIAQQQQLGQQTRGAAAAADPFSTQRPLYQAMLQQLMVNPNKVLPNMPGYQAGLDAVQRAGASQGFTGSGNMATALLKYGGDIFNQQATLLAGLGGANSGSPAASGQLLQQGGVNQTNLLGQSLNSLIQGGSGFFGKSQSPAPDASSYSLV